MTDQNPKDKVHAEHHEQPHGQPDAAGEKRTSRTTLVLIIAGITVLIGAVIAIFLVLNPPAPEDCSAPGSCGQVLPKPAPSPEPLPVTVLYLDSSADFDSPAAWGMPKLTDWEPAEKGEGRATGLYNPALDCTFLGTQDSQPVDATSTSDLPSTTAIIGSLRDSMKALDPNSEVISESTVDVALTKIGSREFIELATLKMHYTVPEGQYASIFFTRSLPHAGNFLLAQLDCPPAVLDGPDTPLHDVLDTLVVNPQP